MQAEAVLLSKAKQFDKDALAQIYDLYSPGIYRYAYRQLGSQDLAEECTAETFSRFLQALRRGKGPREHMRAYLYRTAHNWITDRYRRNPPPMLTLMPELADDESPRVEKQVETRLQAEGVRAHLAALTPEQRQVIVLKFLEGWSNQEIAEAMDKPVGAVKALAHRGIATLRKMMD